MPIQTDLRSPGMQFLNSAPSEIFTVEKFVGDEQLMIQTAEQFSRNEVVPMSERLDQQEEGLMPALLKKAGDLGLAGVDAGEAYGGLGLGKNLAARILEYMSLNASMSVTFGVTTGIGQVGLSLFGTEEQKQKYLPSIVSGETMAAYCLSEPNSGSDALSATTRADLKNGKWVLNGTKMWISNAKWAGFFLVMAQINGDKFSAFLVERDFPGVGISREEHKMGLKGSSTARVVLEDAEVPEENLLHEPGKGHQVALNALNLGRFKLASMSIGPARDAIGLAAQYALDRNQFGQSIAQFGLIRKKFAEMVARFYVAESMIYRTGALIDEAFDLWGGTVDGNRQAAEQYAIECSACKVLSTEIQAFIVDEALQCYGGYGFTEEFPIARHYRDARVSRIYEGTNEINRIFSAGRLLKKMKDGEFALQGGGDGFIGELAHRAIRTIQQSPATSGDFQQNRDRQIPIGAISDLIMFAYAEQSSRLRAQQVGGFTDGLHALGSNWLNVEAARAFQIATGESVSIPAPAYADWDQISDAVYAKLGPL